jgi:hypothetical protein
MSDEDPTPTLIQLLFKDSAPKADLLSPRLLRWAQAFDEWLAEARHPPYVGDPLLAWRYLVELLGAPPWKVTAADIERLPGLAGRAGIRADRTIQLPC